MLLSCFLCAVFVVVDCVCVFAAVVVDSSLVVFTPEYNMCVYGVETGEGILLVHFEVLKMFSLRATMNIAKKARTKRNANA